MLDSHSPAFAVGRRTLLLGGTATLTLPAMGVLGAHPAAAAGIESRTRLTTVLDSYLASRNVRLGLYLHDRRDRSYYSYRTFTNQSLSTIKVLVLVTLLRRAQERRTTLTTYQRSLANKMIRYSDNAATDRLISYLGSSTIRRVASDLGMSSTTFQGGSYGSNWWGYSTTTPRDLLRLEMRLLWSDYLNYTNRSHARALMRDVISTQRWGVCDPPLPSTLHTEVKNGWGPLSGGYRLNSLGYVYGSGRQYALAIVSRSPGGFSHGRTTINRVSTIIYEALDKPLV